MTSSEKRQLEYKTAGQLIAALIIASIIFCLCDLDGTTGAVIGLVAFVVIGTWAIRKTVKTRRILKGMNALAALMLVSAFIAMPYRALGAPGGVTAVSKKFVFNVIPGQKLILPADFPVELAGAVQWAVEHARDNRPIYITTDANMADGGEEIKRAAQAENAEIYTPNIVRGFEQTLGPQPDWLVVVVCIIVIVVLCYFGYKLVMKIYSNGKKTFEAYTNRLNIELVAQKPSGARPLDDQPTFLVGTNINWNLNLNGVHDAASEDLVNWTDGPAFNTSDIFGVFTNNVGQMVFTTDLYMAVGSVTYTNPATTPLLDPGSPIVFTVKPFHLPDPQKKQMFWKLKSNPN